MDMTGSRRPGVNTSGMGTAPQLKEVGPESAFGTSSLADAMRSLNQKSVNPETSSDSFDGATFDHESPFTPASHSQNIWEQATTLFETPHTAADQVGIHNVLPTIPRQGDIFGHSEQKARQLDKTRTKLSEVQSAHATAQFEASAAQETSSARRQHETYSQRRLAELKQELQQARQLVRKEGAPSGALQSLEFQSNQLTHGFNQDLFNVVHSTVRYLQQVGQRRSASERFQARATAKAAQQRRGGLEAFSQRGERTDMMAEVQRAQNEAPHEINDVLGE